MKRLTVLFAVVAMITFATIGCGKKDYLTNFPAAPDYKLAYTFRDTVWVIGLDGSDLTLFASDCLTAVKNVSWSPDGQYLAYSSKKGVAILNQGGGKVAEIPATHAPLEAEYSWSHSGEKLVIIPWGDGILAHSAQTGKTDTIYPHWHPLNSPAFSPNDSVICFVSHATVRSYFCLLKLGESHDKTVTKDISTDWDESLNPAWISPTKILFKADGWGKDEKGIFLLDLESAGDSLAVPRRVVASNDDITDFAVSPNRQNYAYATTGGKLYYSQIGDWSPTWLYDEEGEGGYPQISWSPESDAIAFRTDKRIYWVLLNGTAYRIVEFSADPFPIYGGISVAP